MEVSAGILIIGSLLWDPRRDAWRQERLKVADAAPVIAPIRYGRKSSGRGNTYTMVFSPGCLPGRAVVVPCARTVLSGEDLITEAECLWAAESNSEKRTRTVSAGWGCITLLPNPYTSVPSSILDEWAARVSCESEYGRLPIASGEGRLVNDSGILQIEWPRPLYGDSATLPDLLLATVTQPTLSKDGNSYPSVEAIAQAWKTDTEGHVQYFRKNIENGIKTFQDDAIRERLL